jgi:hypothetical protein
MSEAPESQPESTTVAGGPRAEVPAYDDGRYGRPSRLNQVLVWVGIAAGVLFVVAVVFFSGFFFGWSSDGHYSNYRGNYGGQTGPGGNMGSCPTTGPGGMMGPGQTGPGGMMPGGPTGPGNPPTTSAVPSTPRP